MLAILILPLILIKDNLRVDIIDDRRVSVSPTSSLLGLEFSMFSSVALAAADALEIRSMPRRRREKVAPTPAATMAELGDMVGRKFCIPYYGLACGVFLCMLWLFSLVGAVCARDRVRGR